MTNESRTTRIRGAERVLAWDEGARGPLLAIALRRGLRCVGDHGGGRRRRRPRRRIARGDRRRRHRGDGHARHDQHPRPTSMAAVSPPGFLEEVLDPRLRHSPMYTRKGPFWNSDVDTPGRDGGRWFSAAMRHALAELMASGVTTVVDIQGVSEHGALWCEVLAGSGMRAYVAPSFQEAVWRVRDGRVLEHEWNAERGPAGIRAGRARRSTSCAATRAGRLGGMVFPAQVDTVGEGPDARSEGRGPSSRARVPDRTAPRACRSSGPWSIAPGSRRSGGWRISACWTPPPSSATPSTSTTTARSPGTAGRIWRSWPTTGCRSPTVPSRSRAGGTAMEDFARYRERRGAPGDGQRHRTPQHAGGDPLCVHPRPAFGRMRRQRSR